MSLAFYSFRLAKAVLVIQLGTFIVLSLLFTLKSTHYGASALAGGIAAWLPNILFTFLAWRLQGQSPAKGRVAWSFAFGEAMKVLVTIIMLIVALGVCGAAFWPLAISWLSVWVVQVIAPVVINKKG